MTLLPHWRKIEARECLLCSYSNTLKAFTRSSIMDYMEAVKSRNMLIFQKKTVSWRKLLQQARYDAKEWHDKVMTMDTHNHTPSHLQRRDMSDT